LIFQSAKVIKTIKNYFNLVFAVDKKLCIFARSFKDSQNELQKIKDIQNEKNVSTI